MYEKSYQKAIVEADRIRARAVDGSTQSEASSAFFQRKPSGGLAAGLQAADASTQEQMEDPNQIALEYLSMLRANMTLPEEDHKPLIKGEPGKALAALRQIESGGNYSARGPVVEKGMYKGERAVGAYQVMPGNIPSWTKQVLGYSMTTEEFLADHDAQDKVALAKMSGSFRKYGNWDDAASVWFSGRPMGKNSNSLSDGHNTVSQYVSKFRKAYGAL